MTTAAHNIVAAFDALSPIEQQQVANEILRRSIPDGDVPEAALHELAAEVFRTYDAEEALRATPNPRTQTHSN